MAEANHTPGPWKWDEWYTMGRLVGPNHEPILGAAMLDLPIPYLVARGGEWEGPPYELNPITPDHPDARLIAAAPDLLAACEAALLTRACDAATRDMLRAAVRKTKGE